MEKIEKAVKQFCHKDNINLEQAEESLFKLGFSGDSGNFDSLIKIDERVRTLAVYTFSPIKIPTEKQQQVIEVITRANTQTRYGFFAFSMKSGTVVYNTTIFLGKGNLDEDMIYHLLYANWEYMDIFFPAINAVAFGNISPVSAIASIESKNAQKKDGKLSESKTVEV